MKIQPSDIGRFLQVACKMWNSNYEDDSQIVVLTFTKRYCSIEMAKDGLLLTYLCNRFDAETNEHVMAVPLGLLQDCSNGTGVVNLQVIVENGESHIEVEWNDGLVQCSRRYPSQDPLEYHLMPNLAWHTVDERMVLRLQRTQTETDGGERATNRRENSCPIEPVAVVPR